MEEKEIRGKYAERTCNSQIEFDRLMSEINEEQAKCNHPFLDRENELAKESEQLKLQIEGIRIQLHAIYLERLDLEEKRKNNNRIFHDVKHELIMRHPRECFTANGVEV